jgi:hypothetical protein
MMIAGIGLGYLVIKNLKGIGMALGLGSILAATASLMPLIIEIPEQYVVRTGIFSLMSLVFFVVCFGSKIGIKSNKKFAKNQFNGMR